ncbi:MAG: ATP-binding protein [Psychroflexus maritimus]
MSYKKYRMKDLFKKIIVEKQEWLKSVSLTKRDYSIENKANYVFTGLRRAGKSHFLYQIIQRHVSKNNVEDILMINFEDERLLEVDSSNLHEIIDAYFELYNKQPLVFMDEIQTIQHWQIFARRLADEGLRVFITGSNAEMLSSEIASSLGGRFVNKEILPLSFKEYLSFLKFDYSKTTRYSTAKYELYQHYQEYLSYGGFPEIINFQNKREYLSSVYQKLFYGDLITRFKVTNSKVLKLLVKKLAESVNNVTSVNRIKNLIKSTGVSIGNNTLFDYLSYLESSYLIASISNYHSKFSEKETNKKYYFLDNGILNLFLIDQDTKLLENLVYIQLRRLGCSIYFLKRKLEVDFYVPENNWLIQVSYRISDKETFDREVKSLYQSMKEFDLKKAYLITYDEEKTIRTELGVIKAIPLWLWLLEGFEA